MIKKYICFMMTVCMLISNVFASTTTYERTRENLQVSDDIVVTSSNINSILNTPKVNETEKVYDFADLFTMYEEEQLYNQITNYISETNLDMAVVTINNNPKNSAMRYADDFYDYNYFGTGNNHNGLLFLIDMDTREMWISTTGEAIIMYDDNRIDKILDSAYYEIEDENYYGTALAFIDESEYYFGLGTPKSNKNSYIDTNGNYVESSKRRSNFSPVFPIIISVVIIFIMKGKHKTIKKATTAFMYMTEKKITSREDVFLTTHTDRVYDPPSSSSGGGGSSSHRSSSGRSHGGGGRRF